MALGSPEKSKTTKKTPFISSEFLDEFKSFKDAENQKPRGPLMANTLSALEALPEDVNSLRDSMIIERVSEKINVIMVAIDKDASKNSMCTIDSGGDPLGGYAYSSQSDTYLVNCFDYSFIGIIPMAFRISVPGYIGKNILPLSESLIFKYASPSQRKAINEFKEKNLGCIFQYLQSLSRM
jgi:hypothetical protein